MKVGSKAWYLGILCLCICMQAAAHDFSSYLSASDTFLQKIKAAELNKSMPKLEDEGVASLLSVLSNSRKFLTPYKFRAKDLKNIEEVCRRANNISMSYALYNLKDYINPAMAPAEVAFQTTGVIQKNLFDYQPELELLQPFLIRCMAKQMSALSEFVLGLNKEDLTHIRLSGLRQLRAGITTMYFGTLSLLADQNAKESFKLALLIALSETVEDYHKVLLPESRERIVSLLHSNSGNISSLYQGHIDKLLRKMSKTSCVDLCALQ